MLLTKEVLARLEVKPNKLSLGRVFGGRVEETPKGPYYHITVPFNSPNMIVDLNGNPMMAAVEERTRLLSLDELKAKKVLNGGRKKDQLDLCRLTNDNLLFFDVESTGLNDCPIFLIGTARMFRGNYRMDFYLARDYLEEPDILWKFADLIRRYPYVCSFNGRSFDMPRSINRAIPEISNVVLPEVPSERHIDLYHIAKRVYDGYIPKFTQQNLEVFLFGHERKDDVHGKMIGIHYDKFVRTQNPNYILGVLKHNILDILGMVAIYHGIFYKPGRPSSIE